MTATMPDDGRRRRWVEHRRGRRREFVAAALAAAREHGAATGLDEVAARAGVSKTVIYRHFVDRAELFGAVLDAIADDVLMPRVLRALAHATAGSGTGGTIDAASIRQVVLAFVEVVDAEPQLYRFALAHTAAGRDGDFVAATERRIAQALAAALEARLRESGLDCGGAQVWAFGVVGMVQLATQHWFDERDMPADALADYLAALATGGLAGVLRPAMIP